MNTAQQRAREIRRRYRFRHPSDIERVLKAKGIQVVRFPFAGRLQEMIVGHRIGIQSTIRDPRRVNELLAHALGHFLLHAGNQPFFHLEREPIVAQQWERQAWDFAFELFMPQTDLVRLLRKSWNAADLQEHFEVSEDFFIGRMKVFSEESAITERTHFHIDT